MILLKKKSETKYEYKFVRNIAKVRDEIQKLRQVLNHRSTCTMQYLNTRKEKRKKSKYTFVYPPQQLKITR
jgi:hypothetical protein